MQSTTFRVVLDANALFPNTLRDTLLRATAAASIRCIGAFKSWKRPGATSCSRES